ncbi:cytochrome P450 [Mycena sp. CBHHK59/15]|nr:cytochrome P450 [Mycena sp. CBHHK59/15]
MSSRSFHCSLMSSTLLQTALFLCTAYVLTALLRRIIGRSVLNNIPGPPSKSFLTGNLLQYHNPNGWDFQQDIEENFGGVVRLRGLLGSNILFVFDPKALHSVVIKDQEIYEESPIFISLNLLIFGKSILSTVGDDHRKHRKMIMPAFSTTNLRGMMPHFYDVAERVRDGLIAPQVAKGARELEMASILTRTSLELIGRSGIGYSFDPLVLNAPINEYAESIKNFMPTLGKISLLLPFVPFAIKIGPPSFRRFMLKMIPSRRIQRLRDMAELMDRTARDILNAKKLALQRGDFKSQESMETGTDLMSILLRSNMTADAASKLTDEELVGQTSTIIFAAMDTTSSALARLTHVLAQNPSVQEKLRAEIQEATVDTENGHLDHDTLVELPYLDAVIRETLRLYPPASPSMIRQTIAPTTLPLSAPMQTTDGKIITAIPVPKGTPVHIAIAAANHNREIWGPDAREFKPERWLNGTARASSGKEDMKLPGVYSGTMTFIGGGRSCVGFKFSQLEMKVVISVLLRSFKFSLSDKDVKFMMLGLVVGPTVGDGGEVLMPMIVERL